MSSEELLRQMAVKLDEVHEKVIGDGENGLAARARRSEDRLTHVESMFGKLFALATIPIGALITIAVANIFGSASK